MMDQRQLQSQINDQIASEMGRLTIELIAARAMIAALQKALEEQKKGASDV